MMYDNQNGTDLRKSDTAQVDFAVSFSSIEHNGLGRYGDALDPNGDLRDVELLSCIIRPGGSHAILSVLCHAQRQGQFQPM